MSDLKPSPGYSTIEEEYEDSLRRAFVQGKADFIVLESRRQVFGLESAAYGQRQGWLGPYEEIGPDEQSLVWTFRLTEQGKRHFGILPGSKTPNENTP